MIERPQSLTVRR